MKPVHVFILALWFMILSAIPAQAQTPVNIRQVGDVSIGATVPISGTVTTTPDATYRTPFGQAVTNVSTTAGTVVTASTVLIGTIDCANSSTSTAVTFIITNTAGVDLIGHSFSLPASSDVQRNYLAGKLAVGIKWSASTNTGYCSINGWQ